MERSGNAIDIGEHSAVQSVEQEFGIPVIAIANLSNVMDYLDASKDPALQQYLPAVTAYRKQYGIKAG
jgi:orotate phosphoribosyltransferase